jgi:hypothetical protein
MDGAKRWDEVVRFSTMPLRELQFLAHDTVEMATRRKPMILPRCEDLKIEWASLEAGEAPDCSGTSFPLRGRLVTDEGLDGWGATLWLPGVEEPLLGSSKWRPADIASGKTMQQAWREGWSVILAVIAFVPQMQGGAIPPIMIFCKSRPSNYGNSRHLECRSFTWVPGDRVIDLGADELSRSGGQDWGGYGLNPL